MAKKKDYVALLREARRRKTEEVAEETKSAKAELPAKRKEVRLGRTSPQHPNETDEYLIRLDMEADHAQRFPQPKYNGSL